VVKYNGETNPELWLADFRLACQLGGAREDKAIIRQLPLFLSDTARRWLEELPPNQIYDWADLVRVFEGNFKGTYVQPGNSWDLRNCKQSAIESLRDFARHFSKLRTELPHIPDHDVILAFVSGTSCKELVRELGRNRPKTINELMDVVTDYAAGDEAVGAFFGGAENKPAPPPGDGEGSSKAQKKNQKKKKGNQQVKRAVVEDEVAAAERKKPRPPPDGGVFDKMLKQPCPYHKEPAKHNLEDCRMLRGFFKRLALSKDDDKKGKGGDGRDDDDGGNGYPPITECYMIYGGPCTQMTRRERKAERREVFALRPATPRFLDWSDAPITFDRDDHPVHVTNPGAYPLVVDPIILNARFTKVLMDGGSSLNIIYLDTLKLLGLTRAHLQPSTGGFHGVVPGKKALTIGRIDLPVVFGTRSNFRREVLTFDVPSFEGTYHAILGRPCYTKFMAIPNYAYLKLKMLGPKGVITVNSTYEHTYHCDVECVEYGESLTNLLKTSDDLAMMLDHMAAEASAPPPKRPAGNFKPAEDTKKIPLDPSSSGEKTLVISISLDSA
jgi:hypothetical protein